MADYSVAQFEAMRLEIVCLTRERDILREQRDAAREAARHYYTEAVTYYEVLPSDNEWLKKCPWLAEEEGTDNVDA